MAKRSRKVCRPGHAAALLCLGVASLAWAVQGCASSAPPPKSSETATPATLPDTIVAGPPLAVGDRWLFTYETADAESVSIAGTFNGWVPGQRQMERRGAVWYVVLELERGRQLYKFLVNGVDWVLDPDNTKTGGDGFGGEASSIFVD